MTLFEDFPTDTIIWAVWAIVYQQFENHVIQPQVQKRTVHVHPFLTIVAVLFGATLLGILGALIAIPIAASIQILLREYWDWRTLSVKLDEGHRRTRRRRRPPPTSRRRGPLPAPAGGPVPA